MSDSYWTTGKDTRHETNHRRCGVCGNVAVKSPRNLRFGPCPYRLMHERAEKGARG